LRREEGASLRIQGPDIQGNRRYVVCFRDPDHSLDEGLPNPLSLRRLIDGEVMGSDIQVMLSGNGNFATC
jgi:hypothetical protein